MVDQSRINVALSRAKDRLVIIGSKRMWSGVNAPSALGSRCSLCIRAARHSPDDYEIVDGTTVIEGQRNELMNNQAADASAFASATPFPYWCRRINTQINCCLDEGGFPSCG
ncbi:hypothetical protein AB2C47_30930 [Pseudomonas aeruginosa]